jgi:tetratricopeptide (TPR) repeat protein
LENKVAKLKPLFGESHPSVLAAMEDLSRIYYDRRRYEDAERVNRKLMDVYCGTRSGTELEILDACQRFVDALVAQGRYLQARALNRVCRSAYPGISHIRTPRIAHAISVDALIAEELGYTEEAKSLHRQALQIWLTYCGPRDRRTLNSMTQLGYILALTHGPGGDKLLRTSVQLHLEGSVAADEDACRAMTNLSAAFWAQDTHVEGCQMAKTALDKFLPSLGNEHPDILATKVALARNMTKAGKLSESEQLFREIVSVEASFTGSTKPVGLANSCYGLARVLMMRGFLDEAIELYREVFHARAWSYGWDHRYTLRVCYDLGD